MSINLNLLPNDIFQEIFQHLDPKDLNSLTEVCRVFNKFILNNNFIWDAVAQRTECPFTLKDLPTPHENGAMRLDVKIFVSFLKKSIKNFPENEIPKDIQDIVDDINVPSESQINLLKNYCKVKDTIVLWGTIPFTL
ncbi:MAG: hypothetical protein K1000chlam3_00036 [Chlamydiae bacterium]|nr:hypothetical protein [Chlamydiota bacterium]